MALWYPFPSQQDQPRREHADRLIPSPSCGQGGIGEALAKEYARLGLHPIATVLPSESSAHLVEAGIDWFPLDVTVDGSVAALKQHVEHLTGGRLHILVNNA